jgi:hypothetical protein
LALFSEATARLADAADVVEEHLLDVRLRRIRNAVGAWAHIRSGAACR